MTALFPASDPIPLPAPVWLFKVFHDLTLALHFASLYLLIGGLFLSIAWNVLGHARKSAVMIEASGVILSRLPIVMTYVINLGIPPLLFTQVLYGRALYTSSILIGGYWISVVFVIMAAYGMLYRADKVSAQKRAWWGWGIASLILVMYVGRIYSINMTLMLRPEVWAGMYDATATGSHLPPHDPTSLPRFVLMMLGSLAFGSIGAVLFSTKRVLDPQVQVYLRIRGGVIAALGLILLAASGVWVFRTQPEYVQQGLLSSGFYHPLILGWLVLLGASALGALSFLKKPGKLPLFKCLLVVFPSLLAIGSFVILREGVRDITLAHKGFDVWQSPVNCNWLVVILFVVSLVAGLAGVAWLIGVIRSAKPAEEHYA